MLAQVLCLTVLSAIAAGRTVASCQEAECASGANFTTAASMLQRAWVKNSSRNAAANLVPLAWLHVPKCGSSLMDTFVHLPGVCDLGPNVTSMKVAASKDVDMERVMETLLNLCPVGTFLHNKSLMSFGDHTAIGKIYDEHVKGRGIALFRQPEQRIISGWNDNYHSWPYYYYKRWPVDLQEYANVVSGCAVKMLTRDIQSFDHAHHMPSACGEPEKASTEEETTLAIQRLREGFAFVGITEKWALSMCLFRRMFGGRCHSFDLGETFTMGRNEHFSPQIAKSTQAVSLYNTSELGAFLDIHDRALYGEAQAIFEENLARYDVSMESCEPCFREAADA